MTTTTLRNKLAAVRDQVREAYENGATLRQIADVHEVSMGTVRMALKDMGVTLRRRGRRRTDEVCDPEILAVDLDSLDGEERYLDEEERFEGDNTYTGGAF